MRVNYIRRSERGGWQGVPGGGSPAATRHCTASDTVRAGDHYVPSSAPAIDARIPQYLFIGVFTLKSYHPNAPPRLHSRLGQRRTHTAARWARDRLRWLARHAAAQRTRWSVVMPPPPRVPPALPSQPPPPPPHLGAWLARRLGCARSRRLLRPPSTCTTPSTLSRLRANVRTPSLSWEHK